MKSKKIIVRDELIIRRIFYLREQKVMLDTHLAEIYQVENRALKQAVKRNLDLFPSDFMFVLNKAEVEILVSQNVIPSIKHIGGSLPFAFTESGVAMLSGVLKSKRAKEMNIAVIRAFVSLRKLLADNMELKLAIEQIKKVADNNSKNIEIVFSYLDELMEKKDHNKERTAIGFRK